MFKKVLCSFLSVGIALSLAACGNTSQPSASSNPATSGKPAGSAPEFPEMTLTMQGYNAVLTDAVALEEMKATIEEKTGGKVTVELNDVGALYPQDEAPQAVVAGNLSMNADTIGNLGDYAPELQMFMSPYLFKDADHWQTWFDSEAWAKETDKIASDVGVRILSMWNMGGDMATLNVDRKVTHRSDLADLKMRMPNNAAQLFMGEALGGNVIGMAYNDVYLGLQTGAVDGMVSTYVNITDRSFYEVTKSITVTDHIYGTGYIMINEELWQGMSPELQTIIKDAVDTCCKERTRIVKEQEVELKSFLEGKGMKIYTLTDEEMAGYQKEVTDYVFSKAGDQFRSNWDMELYNAVQALAE